MTSAHESGANFDQMTSEQKSAFFAELGILSPQTNTENYDFFAFIVNQKVSAIFIASKDHMQQYIDALSSNPVIVKLTLAQKNVVQTGWDYDNDAVAFSQPQ